jgi:hypothetical protein
VRQGSKLMKFSFSLQNLRTWFQNASLKFTYPTNLSMSKFFQGKSHFHSGHSRQRYKKFVQNRREESRRDLLPYYTKTCSVSELKTKFNNKRIESS